MTLNKKIWDNGKLKPDIKEKLIIIKNKVLSDLKKTTELDIELDQLLFTGSLASYRWRSSSDVDLHIIIKINNDFFLELIKEFFEMYSKNFNEKYDIFIKSYKVEINVKTDEKILDDKGIYNILDDTWIQKPSKPKKEFDDNDVVDLAVYYQDRIDDLINIDASLREIDHLRKEIKSLRTSGLSEDGEYSTGNMVFKELRHSGYLNKLFQIKLEKENETLSYENFQNFFRK
jgi:predicted nucleotidyltransferase